jgi:eukaryotic-like serine/threonine-protein kinase
MNNGRYSKVELIGSGGFADVYRALNNLTRRTVAIKELRNPTPELLCRFKRERDMLTVHLDNPFVVNILDSNLDGPVPYLVLEYSSLGSLQKYVANRRDWRRIARWLWDIAYGLAMIHERGDLIRDVKPSNLLMFKRDDRSDLIRIADFGVAQRPDNPTGRMTTSLFGTKGYIDPVAQVSGNFRAASDIFSLGVTMRELLTGSRVSWIRIPGPPEFRALIASMTDSNVDNRPTARGIFQRIQAILQAPSVPAVTKPAGDGLGWLLAGAAVVFGVCLLADGRLK